ncbi:hypothetical protein ACQP1P_27285 [Dactylosporangium sp. CA-052675]|uniref:hypothetical protein n=1 Tax=Dactylosporangium sp. CA-052675 TaxID=3239927 RepID=UPI003D91AD07
MNWIDTERADLLVLGDSPAVIRWTSGRTELVGDDRLAATAPAERAAYREHLRAGRGFDTGFAALIAAVQRTERLGFNRPHGFWVAEAEPAAARHAVERTVAIRDLAALILMSDGASAGVCDYGLTDWAGLGDALRDHGVGAWLRRVHAAEESDPRGCRWPRTKRHDDKTAVEVAACPPAG